MAGGDYYMPAERGFVDENVIPFRWRKGHHLNRDADQELERSRLASGAMLQAAALANQAIPFAGAAAAPLTHLAQGDQGMRGPTGERGPRFQESRAESLRKQKLKQDYLDRIVPVLKKLEDEGFRKGGKTHIPTKGDVPTIGYGHTGKYAEANATMTEPFASDLLRSETGERLRVLKRQIPDFYEYDPVTQTALGASQYRGSLGQSPKARALFNARKGSDAGDEFFGNNREVDDAVKNNRAGIIPRMRHTAASMRGSHKPGLFYPPNLMFSK